MTLRHRNFAKVKNTNQPNPEQDTTLSRAQQHSALEDGRLYTKGKTESS